ncbi:hypothetical protein CTheo_1393 [Ceratobasidium theobromae]|uniref:Uncharacterized protein n=1 Tax=Ceratobasidium theobromae TaxID=1582974 RepID=A0A5N5QTL2_9AGAM|nr:hypothetical protein CTheo_1393 [Ceratobasidium theobromae]
MSDEYGASSTKNDTLVNDTALEQITGKGNVGNYSDDSSDTTTEGGYGGDPFSDRSQRGLVDRSIEPGQFSRSNSGISKKDSTPAEHHDPLNPYGDSGPGTPNNGEWQSASDNSASRVADRRREQYESGEGLENDIGA